MAAEKVGPFVREPSFTVTSWCGRDWRPSMAPCNRFYQPRIKRHLSFSISRLNLAVLFKPRNAFREP